MAEALVLGPAIIAFETVRDAPHDLRIILVEVSSLKSILQNVQFLDRVNDVIRNSTLKDTLAACKESLDGLEGLFPKNDSLITPSPGFQGGNLGPSTVRSVRSMWSTGQKRPKFTKTLAALSWPPKVDRAKKLLDEISRHKGTINLALLADSR